MKRLLALALFLLPCAAGAQATIPNYEFVTAAVDYAPNSTTNPDYSLQGSLGQTFVTVDAPTNTNQTLAFLGFGETAVRYRYVGKALLQAWSAADGSGNQSGVPLSVKFFNNTGDLRNTEIVAEDSGGNYYADSWINPSFIGRMSVKAPHWLRRSVTVAAPVNYLAYPTAANALLLNGDVDGNNTVDFFDFAILTDSYGLSLGQSGFNASADLNGDNTVDFFDFAALTDNYGVSGDDD